MTINKSMSKITFILMLLFLTSYVVSAELGYSDPNKPKLEAPTSNIIINLNESLFNVNNSDTVDGYHASAFAKLNEENFFNMINHFDNIQTTDGYNVYSYDPLAKLDYGDNNMPYTELHGTRIDLKDSSGSFLGMVSNVISVFRNLQTQNGANISTNYITANNICYANGTNSSGGNCGSTSSGGSSNLTNVAWINQTNVFTKQQVIALDNNYKLNMSYENGTTQVTSYSNAGGTGDRTATITLSYTFSMSGNPSKLLNGNTADSDPYFFTDATPTGKYLRFDFGAGVSKLITGFKWYQDTGFSHAWMVVQGSNDASTWTNVSVPFRLGGATVQSFNFQTNTNSYRYYQLIAINNTAAMSNNPYTNEIEFNISTGASGYRAKLQGYKMDGSTAGGLITLQEDSGTVAIGKNDTGSGITLDVNGNLNSSNSYTDKSYATQFLGILNTTGPANFNNQNLTNVRLLKIGTTAESYSGTFPKALFSYYDQNTVPTGNTAGSILQTVATESNDSYQTIGTLASIATAYNNRNISYLQGLYLQGTHFGSGIVSSFTGGRFLVQNVGGGNITNSFAGYFSTQTSGGRINNAFGNVIETPTINGGGVINNFYGLNIQSINKTGMTNRPYAILQEGTVDQNSFAGYSTFGGTTVDINNRVSVTGNISATEGYKVNNKVGDTTSINVITSVNFLGSVTTSCTLNITGGIVQTDSSC